MEIQTFFLAAKIDHLPGNRYDVQQAAISLLHFSAAWSFPVHITFSALLVLRREIASDETPFSLLIDLVDEDGRSTGQPSRFRVKGVFPAGPRYFYYPTQIAFVFPSPGNYRLDITADEGLTGGVYSYGIDVSQGP